MDHIPFITFLNNRGIEYYQNYPSYKLNYFETGKYIEIAVFPNTSNQICMTLDYLNKLKIKYFLIGNGTNVYFSDYYDGVIVSTSKLNKISVNGDILTAWCGADISDCSFVASEASLSGLEFAYGIPGSVGGGIYMNCSAYGGTISDIVFKSTVYDISKNEIYDINRDEHLFAEKSSVFLIKDKIALSTSFKLKKEKREIIHMKMNENLRKRILTQPLEYGSGGSTFKKPKNAHASKLIDDCGLKGFCVNGASVSNKHAGFIVNKGNATSEDIKKLIEYLKYIILDRYGIKLEEEIILIE